MEDKIQEIMEEVRMYGAAWFVSGQQQSVSDKDALYFESKAQGHLLEIQSKLRKLAERCSVQEQSTPVQPVVVDDHGVLRFKKNAIVDNLYEHGVKTGYGLNEMYTENHTDEDRMQFAQLIGYSVVGYSTLSYVTDESVNAAFAIANTTKE